MWNSWKICHVEIHSWCCAWLCKFNPTWCWPRVFTRLQRVLVLCVCWLGFLCSRWLLMPCGVVDLRNKLCSNTSLLKIEMIQFMKRQVFMNWFTICHYGDNRLLWCNQVWYSIKFNIPRYSVLHYCWQESFCVCTPPKGDDIYRADSRLAPIQWEASLQSNAVAHWMDANLESALYIHRKIPAMAMRFSNIILMG